MKQFSSKAEAIGLSGLKKVVKCLRVKKHENARCFSQSKAIFKRLYTGKDGTDFIAYRKFTPSSPSTEVGVIFCQGLLSTMNGTKAKFIESYCKEKQLRYICFDYMGHGDSSGKIQDFSISLWKANTLEILNKVAEGPQIIVGSSIGAWIMLLVALEKHSQIQGLIGIASAADLMYNYYESLPETEKEGIKRRDYFEIPSGYVGEPLQLPYRILLDAKNNLVLNKIDIAYNGPVHLMHGFNDSVVPYTYSLDIFKKLRSNDVLVHLIKDGDHQLSRKCDLKFLSNILDQLIF